MCHISRRLKSVTYVLNLLCYLCIEPAPFSCSGIADRGLASDRLNRDESNNFCLLLWPLEVQLRKEVGQRFAHTCAAIVGGDKSSLGSYDLFYFFKRI